MHTRLAVAATVVLGVFSAEAYARSLTTDPASGAQLAGLEVLAEFDHGNTAVAPGQVQLATPAPATETAGSSGNWLVSRPTEQQVRPPTVAKAKSASAEPFRFPGSAGMDKGIFDIQGLDRQATRLAEPGTDPSPTPVPEAQTYALLIGLTALGYALLRHRWPVGQGHRLPLRTDRRSTGL
jgi:hypothetical protein